MTSRLHFQHKPFEALLLSKSFVLTALYCQEDSYCRFCSHLDPIRAHMTSLIRWQDLA